jgi:Fe2+ transport system protein FeoA
MAEDDAVDELVPLGSLGRGQRGEINQLLGERNEVHRLEEMGLRSGVEVEMLQPGSPCIVRLDGHRLCFRMGDLFHILVRPGRVV